MKRISRVISGAFLVSIALVVSMTELVDAFSTTYFYDDTDSTGDGSTVLVAGKTQYVPNAQAHVRAYFSSPHGQVGIAGGNYCPGGTWDSGRTGLTGVVTRFQIGTAVRNGVYRSGSCNGTKDSNMIVTFNSMPHVTIGTQTLYYVDVVATNQASDKLELQNGFRVYQPISDQNNSRMFIAQVGGDTGNQVTIQQTPNDGKNRNYYFRFGADCTVTSDTYQAVSFYDLDNTGDTSGAQNNKKISLSISEVSSSGVPKKVPLAYYTVGNDNRRSYINNTDWVPKGGSGVKLNIYFLLKPGARYMATLTNVYSNNTIQFSTPFDGVYYEKPCSNTNNWSVSGNTTGPTGNVPVGTKLQWMHYLYKDTGLAVSNINFAVQQWKSGESTYHDLAAPLSGSWTLPSNPTGTTGSGFWHSGADYTTTDADIGKQICQRIRWRGTSSTDNSTSYSDAVCATVVVNPAVHILGNDVRVGSDFSDVKDNNGSALIAGSSYATGSGASYGEYGVFAPKDITSFASQGGGSLKNPALTTSKSLTFSNTSTSLLGNYTTVKANLGTIPDSADSFPSSMVEDHKTASVSLGDTITDGVRIIKTTGDITINGNLTYGSGGGGVEKLPQLILIGKNINIASGVNNVDAWLIASDTVDTCSDVKKASDLTTKVCNNQLTINGPVMAKTLKLKRTYYTSTEPDKAAETIRMRGDAYVVSEQLAQQQGGWQTVYTTDLPPRY